ncbi:MAG: hypothetical protein LC808_07260 [Actinobacteria bacterium]|nr:hypothetical protein [Actinomycetota bacterium]
MNMGYAVRVLRTACLSAALGGALLVGNGAPAQAQGAVMHSCAVWPDPDMSGNVIYTPSGGFLMNCRVHIQGGGGSTGEAATIVECWEVGPEYGNGHLERPGKEDMQGVQVITPSGGVYTNCVYHRP